MNAEASASARVVEARDALTRCPKGPDHAADRARLEARLAMAQAAHRVDETALRLWKPVNAVQGGRIVTRNAPYAGVTGFMLRDEVEAAVELLDGAPPRWL